MINFNAIELKSETKVRFGQPSFLSSKENDFLYNCSCWAAPKKALDSVNIIQRKHLREILKIFWHNVISNKSYTNGVK